MKVLYYLVFRLNFNPEYPNIAARMKASVLAQIGTDHPATTRSNPVRTLSKCIIATIEKTALANVKNVWAFIRTNLKKLNLN